MQPSQLLSRVLADHLAYRRRRTAGPAGDNPFGDLRATVPIARAFGFDRGRPIDRVFVEQFMAAHADIVRGRVLEIGDNAYTLTYGGPRVTESDILHFDAGNPKATFIGDLSACDHIPDALFDCIILTQTLQMIFDIGAALANVHRLLAPGGTVLATFPGVSQISDEDWGTSWCWGWSAEQARRLIETAFPGGTIRVAPLGNRFAAVAFLFGLVAEDLDPALLAADPGSCDFLIGAVARRGSAEPACA